MNFSKLSGAVRRLGALVLALVLVLTMPISAHAAENKNAYQKITATHRDAEFTYELFLMDQTGASVENPRKLSAGDTLFVEIRLSRNGYKGSGYDSYGVEFRLLTRGLTYNYDGTTLRGGTEVRELNYSDGDSVGFAWYDMQQKGETINNPVLAGTWSYTVEDPSMVNITVPVALIYITGDNQQHVPVGKATLFLDPNGGELLGPDVSGTYPSGTEVILPDVKMGDWVFAGWSDGVHLYPAGSAYVVSGIVTLTAQWEELERNRYLRLDPNGGQIVGEDISGYYADGEIVTLPDAVREGYTFLGWELEGTLYAAGDSYTVTNTVTFKAQWEPDDKDSDDKANPGTWDDGDPYGAILMGTGLLALLLWLILLLWKRRYVKYSLVNGDVKLRYRNGDAEVKLTVILLTEETQHTLAQSGIKANRSLQYISNMGRFPIAPVEPGKYDGTLVILEGENVTVKKCRIKALDKELKK